MDLKSPIVTNFKLSPSDLTYLLKTCKRCFYDKAKNKFKPPTNFSEHFTNADRAMKEALASNEIVDLGVGPKFRVVAQGEWVESQPIPFETAGVTLSFAGKYDAVVVTEADELFVVDYKTTTLNDNALAKFAPQLQSYVTAIELPKVRTTKLPAYVDGMAIIVFDPARFAFNPRTKNCGLYGRTRWVELPRDERKFDELLTSIATLIAHPTPPRSAPTCDVCRIRFPLMGEHSTVASL